MKIENSKLKIIFFGTPSFVIPVLQSLIDNFDVVGVVTTPDTPQGRKKILTPTPVALLAMELNIPIFKPKTFDIGHLTFDIHDADLFVTAAYGKLIPEALLKIPKYGSLNIHPSLLPKYRGPSPIQSAILNGDKETGVSIIEMDMELDHGPILAQETVVLSGNETFKSLHEALFQKAAKMLPTTIGQFSKKTIIPLAQDESKFVWCKKITKEDGFFEMDNPPEKERLDRMIRAYYPWPTAWTKWKITDNQWKILKFLPDKKIQIEGGKAMTIKDFLNGYPEMKETIEIILH